MSFNLHTKIVPTSMTSVATIKIHALLYWHPMRKREVQQLKQFI